MSTAEAWQPVAPNACGGGTVAALKVLDDAPLMFAATSAGVFRSWDAGLTWHAPSAAGLTPLAEGLAISPEFVRDRTAYACAVDGLYRSTDAGDSWQPILVGSRVLSVACLDREVVLAGTEADGVLRSADAGRTWHSASPGLLDLAVGCLAGRGGLAFAGTPAGLHRSRNAGQAWRLVGPETPIQCVAISPEGGLVLVGTERDGLFRSTDDGATWHAVGLDGAQSVSALAIASDCLAAATPLSVCVSHDGGLTWLARASPGVVLALAVSRAGLLAGLHQDGLVRSVDDAATWSPPEAGINARLISAAAFARDGTFYVADIDAGLRVSADHGISWRPYGAGLEPPSAMAVSADHALFVSSPAGVCVNRPGAKSWSLLVPASVFGGAEITALASASNGLVFVATRTEAEASVWRSTGDVVQRCLVVPGPHAPRLAASADGAVIASVGNRLFDVTSTPAEQTPHLAWSATALALRNHSIFVGTHDGVFVSQDRAKSFVDWSEGLPATVRRIVALGAVDDGVYAMTFGGQIWRRAYPTRRITTGLTE